MLGPLIAMSTMDRHHPGTPALFRRVQAGVAARRHGFTLVELIVVVAVVLVLLTLVAPAFEDLIARQRVQSVNAELVSDLHFARTEALHRNKKIVMAFGTNDTMTCYTIYTHEPAGVCTCLRPEGGRCLGLSRELKTVTVLRRTTVAVAASSAQLAEFEFDTHRGDIVQAGAQVEVTSTRSGSLLTQINQIGRTTVCSPNGSISGVPSC